MRPRYQLDARDANEPEIIEAFCDLGCRVRTLRDPVDLLVAVPRGSRWFMILVEVKLPAGPRGGVSGRTLTDAQRVFFDEWPSSLRFVVRDAEECASLVDDVQRMVA